MSIALFIGFLTTGNAASPASFDVTSVKINRLDPRARSHAFGCTDGHFQALGSHLDRSIKWAWNLDDYQIVHAPDWITAGDAYDIEGKGGADADQHECKIMVQGLLAQRFQLSVHSEKRLIDSYDLVIDRTKPKIEPVRDPDAPINGPGFTINGVPMQMFDPTLKGWTMEQLSYALSVARLGRPVFDRTGLAGIFRISLSFQQRDTSGDGPDITSALREQLGLKLVPRKEPVVCLIIDRVEKPGPN